MMNEESLRIWEHDHIELLTSREMGEWLHRRDMNARAQGEYVDISKLRLMTVEECAGHTIDYAMGWRACIEWIKRGCAK
ncbi:MAG: hypothetical protein IKG01_13565 [Lachnospiraceae bacterium]|nr:hypothetical protein [Lachnospiraceae bacterium]